MTLYNCADKPDIEMTFLVMHFSTFVEINKNIGKEGRFNSKFFYIQTISSM